MYDSTVLSFLNADESTQKNGSGSGEFTGKLAAFFRLNFLLSWSFALGLNA